MEKTFTFDISGCKIVILEDSPFMAGLLANLLQSFDALNLKITDNLTEFQDMLVNFGPDLILSDWELKGFGGADIVQLVRENNNIGNRCTPIIVITGYTERERITKMLALGVDDVIVKPISGEQLFGRICNLIQNPKEYVEGPKYLGPKHNVQFIQEQDEA